MIDPYTLFYYASTYGGWFVSPRIRVTWYSRNLESSSYWVIAIFSRKLAFSYSRILVFFTFSLIIPRILAQNARVRGNAYTSWHESATIIVPCTYSPKGWGTIQLTLRQDLICWHPWLKLGGILIDNFICKYSEKIASSTSGILLSLLSDHQPCFTCLTLKHNHHKTTPKYIHVGSKTPERMNHIIV